MNAYMRGFVILFVLLVLLSYLPPGKQYRKYIRFYAESVTVELGEDHTMQEICIYITDENADEISVGRISVSDAAESGEGQEVCGKVKEELAAYYGMEDSGIRVSYVGGT